MTHHHPMITHPPQRYQLAAGAAEQEGGPAGVGAHGPPDASYFDRQAEELAASIAELLKVGWGGWVQTAEGTERLWHGMHLHEMVNAIVLIEIVMPPVVGTLWCVGVIPEGWQWPWRAQHAAQRHTRSSRMSCSHRTAAWGEAAPRQQGLPPGKVCLAVLITLPLWGRVVVAAHIAVARAVCAVLCCAPAAPVAACCMCIYLSSEGTAMRSGGREWPGRRPPAMWSSMPSHACPFG